LHHPSSLTSLGRWWECWSHFL